MIKVFYNKKTLAIVGMSDGESSMELPFVETPYLPVPVSEYKIKSIKGKKMLVPNKFQRSKKEWHGVITS